MRVIFIQTVREVPTEKNTQTIQWTRLQIEKDLPFLPCTGMSVWFPSIWTGEDGDPMEFVVTKVAYDTVTEAVECSSEVDTYEADEYPGMYAERVATMLKQGWTKQE